MINYGIVYPQAILVFVITLLYSVIQPLILVFGAVYFGVAYVVYKYKLLFGKQNQLREPATDLINFNCSILQAVRITRPGMADHLPSPHLGCPHFHHLHERHVHCEEVVRPGHASCTSPRWHLALVVLHRQAVPAAEQVR